MVNHIGPVSRTPHTSKSAIDHSEKPEIKKYALID